MKLLLSILVLAITFTILSIHSKTKRELICRKWEEENFKDRQIASTKKYCDMLLYV